MVVRGWRFLWASHKKKKSMRQADVLRALQTVYNRHNNEGALLPPKDVALFSKHMDGYINTVKGRQGRTVLIRVATCPIYNRPIFEYTNADGESTTASMRKAVSWNNKKQKPVKKTATDAELTRAMRFDVRDQIMDFKRNLTECELCGRLAERTSNGFPRLEADHFPLLFRTIKASFLSTNRQRPPVGNHGIEKTILDDVWRVKWQQFHSQRATYRGLCKACHVQHGHRK